MYGLITVKLWEDGETVAQFLCLWIGIVEDTRMLIWNYITIFVRLIGKFIWMWRIIIITKHLISNFFHIWKIYQSCMRFVMFCWSSTWCKKKFFEVFFLFFIMLAKNNQDWIIKLSCLMVMYFNWYYFFTCLFLDLHFFLFVVFICYDALLEACIILLN